MKETSPRLEKSVLLEGLADLIDFLCAREIIKCEEAKIRDLGSEDAKDLCEFALVLCCNEE